MLSIVHQIKSTPESAFYQVSKGIDMNNTPAYLRKDVHMQVVGIEPASYFIQPYLTPPHLKCKPFQEETKPVNFVYLKA